MSQPRRRRRRRGGSGRGGSGRGGARAAETPSQNQASAGGRGQGGTARRRRRRRTGRGESAAATLESIIASYRTPREERLTADPDGQDLDHIISELQSKWGVPQYPQEYRITIKVAEERSERVDRANGNGKAAEARRSPSGAVREKAPAAPRVASSAGEENNAENGPAKPRKRRRRGRRRKRGGGGDS